MPRLFPQVLRSRLQTRQFTELFVEELGWDRLRGVADVTLYVRGTAERLRPIAQKRDVPLYLYRATPLPDRARRRAIEAALARQQREHLVVFVDDATGAQVWQWVKREPGRPDRVREHAWRPGDDPEGLRQKLDALQFTLEEEDQGRIGATDVTDRLQRAFDADEVTKRFYDEFKTRHDALMAFLKGLPNDETRSWYASVTLNRLMFIYFIQKRGFLGGDTDYLNRQLARSRAERGKDRFFAEVLCPLFFRGFALPEAERRAADRALLGTVPYLNGGLFEQHQIEREHDERIVLPDKAFVDLFAFFDGWRWHLDERRTGGAPDAPATGREINPDVLGYIFEKYVNQKQMGAYYTKEDVTEYICANTILPRLLDKVAAEVRPAFAGPDSLWRLLRQDPDRYIWPSVRHGAELALPEIVAAGVDDVSRREQWSQPGDRDLALVTETWREVVHRRAYLQALRAQLRGGQIASPDAMVTANLDLARFTADAIGEASEDALKAWWGALKGLTVLDPACGSGAFLFAALNLLEPLYTAVFEAMQTTVADARRAAEAAGRAFDARRYRFFTEVLEEAACHPNAAYFVLRQITLNNLFGVDVMEEAAEICKLRLFLKLVAQLDDPRHIEPLPDLDFNIRSGNSLVGFVSEAALDAAEKSELDLTGAATRIKEGAEVAAKAYTQFRQMQEQAPLDARELAEAKEELRSRLADVATEADGLLAWWYGVPRDKPKRFIEWRQSHEPFHWTTNFYGVMHLAGFDVVVGNPPYVQRSKITSYATRGYATDGTPDIYAAFVERGLHLLHPEGRLGLILPISFQFSSDFASARDVIRDGTMQAWVSTFSRNPAALFFAGLGVRNTILLARRGEPTPTTIHSSRLHRWVEEARPHLFEQVSYLELPVSLQREGWARLDNQGLTRLFARLAGRGHRLVPGRARKAHELRFKNTALYYISTFSEDPPSFDGRGRPISHTMVGQITFDTLALRDCALAITLGKLSVLWWAATGDDFHVTSKGLGSLPISPEQLPEMVQANLAAYGAALRREMPKHVIYTQYAGKKMGNYDIKYLRHLTDEIDRYLLEILNAADAWEDVEVAYARFMKMTKERPGTTRADLTEAAD